MAVVVQLQAMKELIILVTSFTKKKNAAIGVKV